MKVTSITYEKLISLGNFEHESYTLMVELAEDETPHEAFMRARAFIAAESAKRPGELEIANARNILANPDAYTGYQVKEAEKIHYLSQEPEDIPF